MENNSCAKCHEKQKKMKIIVSDYEFQLKKMQQDKSTQKAMYEIYLQKQVRRWQEMYHKQKSSKQDQVKNWMNKYDITIKKYEQEIKTIVKTHLIQTKNNIQSLNNESERKIKELIVTYQQKIATTINKHEQQVRYLKNEHELKINQLIIENQNQISSMKRSHKALLDQKIKMYESRILGAESQRLKQQKLHEQTKNQSKDVQSKLYHQLFGVRKNVTELQQQLQQQIKYSRVKQENIQELKREIQNIINQHEQQVKNLIKNHEKAIQHLEQNYKLKITQLLQQNLTFCKKYESAIEKIQQKRENQKTIYMNNIQEINVFVGNRASRPEDIQEIYTLRQTLSKKSRQCQCLAQQLKIYRLQLQNKEQTYNKIFVPITNQSNQNVVSKRKQFKLRRQGKSVTTVREALQSINSVNMGEKKTSAFPPKPKIL